MLVEQFTLKMYNCSFFSHPKSRGEKNEKTRNINDINIDNGL